MRQVLYVFGLSIVFAVLYLVAWPVVVKPVAWNAPMNLGYVGDYEVNQKLQKFDRLSMGSFTGPEAAVPDVAGNIVAATHEGWIVRWPIGSIEAEPWIDVGGRPLGVDFDADGNLWIANAYSGLMKLDTLGQLSVELTEVDGIPIEYADDVVYAANGKVYFSDASTRFAAKKYQSTLAASLLDIMEHSDNGRIIEFDPTTGDARTLMSNLTFANGVTADPTGRFILVAETGEYRIWKHWISGPDTGKSEVIIDNLPGFPDNVHIGQNGRYWIGLTAPRSKVLDDLAGEPFWRSVVQRLPAAMRPKVEPYGMVLAIDESGEVLHNLQAPNGEVYATTGVAETNEHIYVTSLTAPFLARYKKADLEIE